MSALNTGVARRDNTFYRVRAHAYKMYRDGKWHINDLYRQNRSKLLYGGHCYYCGKECSPSELTADHVFPRSKGGDSGVDNIMLACKSCNASKGSMGLFEWHFTKLGYWPDTFLLTHYLKQIYQYSKDNDLLCNFYYCRSPHKVLTKLPGYKPQIISRMSRDRWVAALS